MARRAESLGRAAGRPLIRPVVEKKAESDRGRRRLIPTDSVNSAARLVRPIDSTSQENQANRQSAQSANREDRQQYGTERQDSHQEYGENRQDERQDYDDDHYQGGGYYHDDDGDVAAAAAIGLAAGVVIGSMVTASQAQSQAQASGCSMTNVEVNGITHARCGASWHQPAYDNGQLAYQVVNPSL